MIIAEKRRMELAAKVKLILASANIPRIHFAKTLCEVLELSSAQGYRKLRGESDFTLPQIAVIEQHFGVELLYAVDIEPGRQPVKGTPEWVRAEFRTGTRHSKCHIIVGRALHEPLEAPFAAYLDRGYWRVCLVEEREVNAPLFEVEKLSWSKQSGREI